MAEEKRTVGSIQVMGQGLVAAILGALGVIAAIWALISFDKTTAEGVRRLGLTEWEITTANVIFLIASALVLIGGLLHLLGRPRWGHWICLFSFWVLVVVGFLVWLIPSFTFLAAGNIISVAVAAGMIYWLRLEHRKKKKQAAPVPPPSPPAEAG
ncbi:MAG: hypothetical protein KJ621_06100 [Proteobacteria bacterium]|nr:hypothetical protein [Pseudomonadota bacterium]MBU1740299.1 hypothetical protein [Pseudomonadota bacterium]